ncbi:MAG: YggS family pyridoxal phosphate-dependent enzyme [Candidatus Hodarchaeales archaeon]
MIEEDHIIKNYHKILSLLEKYSHGREIPQVVMVTKDQTADLVLRILNRLKRRPIIGENRVQEALTKIEVCGATKAEWHFIGHLQRNKVKKILGKFSLIHSLDRLPLAREIEKRASKENIVVKCLLQIDISQDGSKFGFYPTDEVIKDVLLEIGPYSHLKIEGLMAIAPYVSPEDTREYFSRMCILFENIMKYDSLPSNVEMKVLSMGMSNDYVIALEEGSTMIRLGRRIFGEYD